jgi:GTP-binding protein
MRHGPTKEDLRAIDYLAELQLPTLIVFTKADKLTATERRKAMEKLPERLGVEQDQTLAVSALSGDGIEELLETIGGIIQTSIP